MHPATGPPVRGNQKPGLAKFVWLVWATAERTGADGPWAQLSLAAKSSPRRWTHGLPLSTPSASPPASLWNPHVTSPFLVSCQPTHPRLRAPCYPHGPSTWIHWALLAPRPSPAVALHLTPCPPGASTKRSATQPRNTRTASPRVGTEPAAARNAIART